MFSSPQRDLTADEIDSFVNSDSVPFGNCLQTPKFSSRMSDDRYFNVQQSSKLADYLKKFDMPAKKNKSLPSESGEKSKRKITVEDDLNFSSKYAKKQQSDRRTVKSDLSSARTGQPKAKDEANRSDKLRSQCVEKLMQSQFRNINQYLYENPTVQAIRYMTPDLFHKYHESYSQLVAKWPVKPLGKYFAVRSRRSID